MTSNLTTAAIVLAIVALFCWLSNDDYQAEQDNQVYVAEIMQKATDDALADKQERKLIMWGNQFAPVAMGSEP